MILYIKETLGKRGNVGCHRTPNRFAVKARMNVIHEVGLFQGRLGFERAIVLLEEGC